MSNSTDSSTTSIAARWSSPAAAVASVRAPTCAPGPFPVGFEGGRERTWFEVQKWYSGIVLKMRRIPQPIVAAVNGPAAGGGFSIAMASDVRVVNPDAYFVAAQVNIGQAASEMGATYFLPQIVGRGLAAEILLTGRRVDAEEAHRIGLANFVSEPGRSVDRALELAGQIASKAPLSVRLTKEAFESSANATSLEMALAAEDRSQTLCVLSDDLAEGQAAWVEGRPPQYKG